MMNWGYGAGWGWLMAFVMVGGILLLGVAVALLFAIATRTGRSGEATPADASGASGAHMRSDAERELEMRFARGEIDVDALIRGRAALRDR